MTISRNLSFLAEGVSSTGVLGATYGGTGQSSITTGDLLYGSASNTISKLAIGSTGTVLRVVAGVPSWGTDYTGTVTSVAATVPSFLSISGSPITTSGTLAITYSGTALPIANGGTAQTSFTAGQVLYGSFSQSANLFWDSTNNRLGIGTSSPSYKLDVSGTAGNADIRAISTSASGAGYSRLILQTADREYRIVNDGTSGSPLLIYDATAAATRLTLDTSGNFGIGVTPSSWSVGKAVELGQTGNAIWSPGSIFVTQNTYYNGGYKYASTAAASYYQQNVGIHYWFNAPSGTAGSAVTFTQAMTLDNNGNLGIGITPSAWNSGWKAIELQTTGNGISGNGGQLSIFSNAYRSSSGWTPISTGYFAVYQQSAGVHTWDYANGTAGSPTSLITAMTLDTSGNLWVGTTPSGTAPKGIFAGSSSTDFNALTLRNSNGTTGSTSVLNFETSSGGVGDVASLAGQIKGIRVSGGTTGALAFWTNNSGTPAEAMRIDSNGNLLVGTTTAPTGSGNIRVKNGFIQDNRVIYSGSKTLAASTATNFATFTNPTGSTNVCLKIRVNAWVLTNSGGDAFCGESSEWIVNYNTYGGVAQTPTVTKLNNQGWQASFYITASYAITASTSGSTMTLTATQTPLGGGAGAVINAAFFYTIENVENTAYGSVFTAL
jgi:hypothetical protein